MLTYITGKKYRPGDDDNVDLMLIPVIFNYRDLYLPTRAEILGEDDANQYADQEE